MGKREHEEKRNRKKINYREMEKGLHTTSKVTKPPVEQASLALKNDEEIVCDGEVEMLLNDETVEVEITEDNVRETSNIANQPSTSAISKKLSASNAVTLKRPSSKLTAPTLSPAASVTSLNSGNTSATKKNAKKQRRDSGTSSDEERWLTAIESGKLDDVDDELKKIKDPKLMTARQRSLYERSLDKDGLTDSIGVELLMSLPIGYREKEKPQTAEDIQKAALKSQKRKQLADEKREKDKKKTMDRLLKKQESNKQRAAARSKAAAAATKATAPIISYRNTPKGSFIQMPAEHDFPLKAQTAREPPKVQKCGIAGCTNAKIYNCSKTNIPLCSFACYRKNVQAVRQIML